MLSEPIEDIAARAQASQVGRLPTDPRMLTHTLYLSTATREFLAGARHDVLTLIEEVRRLRRALAEARQEAEFYREEARLRPDA